MDALNYWWNESTRLRKGVKELEERLQENINASGVKCLIRDIF